MKKMKNNKMSFKDRLKVLKRKIKILYSYFKLPSKVRKNTKFIYFSISRNEFISETVSLINRMDKLDKMKYQYKKDISFLPNLFYDLNQITHTLNEIKTKLQKYEQD